jgi:small nuclear ribonucleoprotein (snRNP)-like protein
MSTYHMITSPRCTYKLINYSLLPMESPALSMLQKNMHSMVRIITLNNKTYRGVLHSLDMNVNVHLKDGYEKTGEGSESYVGEVLVSGGSIAFFDMP